MADILTDPDEWANRRVPQERAEVVPVPRAGHPGSEGAPGRAADAAAPASPLDLGRGTRNIALALNTSYTDAVIRRKETPLGDRHSVYAITATGNKRELAALADPGLAEVVRAHLLVAMHSLEQAAAAIVRDREEQR